jgi:hypothetical protein
VIFMALMSFKATFARPVFLVRWTAPRLADVPRLTTEFNRAYEAVGQALPYIAIVPQECEPPDEAARKSMTKGRDEILDRCVSMHLVMEGEGFRYAILRNAFAAMQLFGKKREKVTVHRSLEEALDEALLRAPAELKFDKRAVIAKAITAGVASPYPPSPEFRGTPGTR